MRVAKFVIVLTIAAMMLVGCVGTSSIQPSWERVYPGYTRYAGKLGFTAALPAGWMAYEDAPTRSLLLTRHSVPLDFVHIKRFPLSAPLQHTDLTFSAGMRPYELAEIAANNLRSTPGVFGVTLEELAPDQIDGREAFRMIMLYAMENGMRRRCLVYGFISGNHYNEIGLYALEDYYFGAVVEEFLEMVKTFSVKN